MLSTLVVFATLALSTAAHDAHSHDVVARSLPSRSWHHDNNAKVRELFVRQGGSTAAIGSPAWVAQYPSVTGVPSPAESDVPARWLAAYNAAKNAGKIPNIPVTTLGADGVPVYPAGTPDGTDPSICSATRKCRQPADIWDAPTGVLAVSFDDGPVAVAPILYNFLHTNNVPSTHFMIGRVILGDLTFFSQAYDTNHASIAVHTWSHPMMTTQTDLQAVVEIGWTMQIIHDLTGGRVPKFWRPPLGDADLRIRAIATEVFNLTTVIWNQDTEDWRIAGQGYPGAFVEGNLTNWLNGPKTPGLIILEHELTNDTINFFMNTTYPLAIKNGWKLMNIPDSNSSDWYLNSHDDVAQVSSLLIGVTPPPGANTTSPGSATTGGSTGGSTGGTTGGSSGSGAQAGGSSGKGNGAGRAGVSLAAVLLVVAAAAAVL